MINIIFVAVGITGSLFISAIISVVVLFLIVFICFGFIVGRFVIYRKTFLDRQKVELKYKIYTKKWLKNLNQEIIQINSSSDSIPLRLHIIKPKNKITKKVVVFHHGVTASHVVGYKHAKYYFKKNYTFVSYDSRGWGDNLYNGNCTFGILEKLDLLDVVKYLHSNYKINEMLLHGESMGGKTVLEYATHYDDLGYVQGYIVDSGFVDFYSIFAYNFKRISPYIPICFVYPTANMYIKLKTSKTIYKNSVKDLLYKIQSPVLVIQSPADSMVSFTQFSEMLERIQNFDFLTTPNSPHCLTSILYRDKFINKVYGFLEKIESIKK